SKDGLLDVLSEATRRNCNAEDDDGLTPTLWAAFEGNLEALRLLVGRGGDPDKCDYYGNTALHLASAEGQLNCVCFLVNFGVNMWALDNDLHTAKDRAADAEREDILRFLDNAMAEQEMKNKKLVASLKEKALVKAEKRVKMTEKQHREAEKRAKGDEKKLMKQRQRMYQQEPRKNSSILHQAPSKFSDIVNTGTATKKSLLGLGIQRKLARKEEEKEKEKAAAAGSSEFQVAEQVKDGKRSMRSLTGLRRDSEVLYVPKFNAMKPQLQEIFENKQLSRARSEPEFVAAAAAASGLFERPGFGSMAFRQTISGTLMSLRQDFNQTSPDAVKSSSSDRGSIGSADSLEDDDSSGDNEPIITFLASLGLSEFIPRFLDEQIDLDALLLLTDDDLRNIVQPLGPRRKLIQAIQDRKEAIENPGQVFDSRL
uniref:SAM domain-containing protein n=1 Tax=Strigamia maritima TaxID=126957 RepID=T1JIG7_STRMM